MTMELTKKTSYAEFSSQLNDKNTVILEIGRNYTRCGFAGEQAPRAIIKSCTKSGLYLHTITDPAELEVSLGNFIDKIYFNHLAVSPKEKKLVIVESVFCKSIFRNTLTRVFFDQFNVPSILFVPDHLMALATLGRSTGIVLDIGSQEAISIAVVDGVTLLDGTQFANLGARTLDALIYQELVKNDYDLKEHLKPEIVEDIRLKACFVAPYERGLKMTVDKAVKSKERQQELIRMAQESGNELSLNSSESCYFLSEEDGGSPASVNYIIEGHKSIKIPGNLREGACEVLFEIFAHEHSLTTMLVETISKAPIDCRRSLAENILVIGGLSNLPGLEHRLSKELVNVDRYDIFERKNLVSFKFHEPICARNYVCWLGASMFCTPCSIELRSTTREQWIRDGKKNLRDWSDLIR